MPSVNEEHEATKLKNYLQTEKRVSEEVYVLKAYKALMFQMQVQHQKLGKSLTRKKKLQQCLAKYKKKIPCVVIYLLIDFDGQYLLP